MTSSTTKPWTMAGLDDATADKLTAKLQERLTALVDLQLTLKHIHWNVVGPNFIAVHEMLDPQVDDVREMTDDLAERIATLGGTPVGTPGFVAKTRTWDEYDLGRTGVTKHLTALNAVYDGVIGDHRRAMVEFGDLDPVSEDMMIGQLDKLELFQWFTRSHIADADGNLPA